MKKYYYSTRNKENESNDIDAILKGLADDGGLYVWKDRFPRFDLTKLCELDYRSICAQILHTFMPSFDQACCQSMVEAAYQNKFDDELLTPVKVLSHDYILELFHGPTSAFKDLALCVLPQLMSNALKMQKDIHKVMILTATSGDTGKAAMCGFQDVANTAIMVFYPHESVSEIQQKQMRSQLGENVDVEALIGNFDDAQTMVKKIFQDKTIQATLTQYGYQFSSANSINIGRLIPQITYYFDSYRQLVEKQKIALYDKVCFSVPTGNFGDILAGYYAKCMGLPIHKLICGVNENRVLYDFFKTGCYDRNRTFYKTTSPSMDILVSSNLERFLFALSDHDDCFIKELMTNLQQDGHFEVPNWLLKRMQAEIFVEYASDSQCHEIIKTVFEEEHYLMDPHTAVAWHAKQAYQDIDQRYPVIVLSTASPYKFPNTVYQALHNIENKDEWQCISALYQESHVSIPEGIRTLQDMPIRFSKVISEADMAKTVIQFVKELK